jgi:nucleotide-binding universal stress UspA family protein
VTSFKHILVPTDFGDASDRALELGIDFAERYQAALTVVHVHDVPAYAYGDGGLSPVDFLGPLLAAAQQALDDEVAKVRKKLPRAKGVLLQGDPWRHILSTAQDMGADLIVMGTHGRRGLSHAILGSVAERVVRFSPVPVLTIRAARPPPEPT